MAKRLLAYTREPKDAQVYSHKLAYSLHLAIDTGDGFKALNHNYGILFALATEYENGTLNPKALDKPCIFKMRDGYGIAAVSLRAETEKMFTDEEMIGKVLLWETKDFVHYTKERVLSLSDSEIKDVFCETADGGYKISWLEADGWKSAFSADLTSVSDVAAAAAPEYETDSPKIEGIIPRNIIEIPDDVADYLFKKTTVAKNISIDVPEELTVSTKDELHALRVTAHYSDGTTAKKRIDWYDRDIDFTVPGTYEIKGRIHQDRFEFPMAWHRADPCIGKWNGKYYFIATNDRDGNNSLYIRESDTVAGLVTAQEIKILDVTMYPHMKGLLWAPEFHEIKGELYIFHAATPDGFHHERSHVMKLRHGGNPMVKEDWEPSRLVLKANGEELYTLGITLDMTTFEIEGRQYAIWSQRRYNPCDYGAWLYIAEIDQDEPWKLKTEPVAISRPDYSWANNRVYVDEGPYPLLTKDKIFITFSAALCDETYVVALLTADYGTDLLDPKSWTKGNFPILTSANVKGEFGTGHNAYVVDDEGDIWNTYHGRPGVGMPRCAGVRRVHFDIDGEPVLGMTEELDLAPELTNVSVKVTVK